MTYSASSMSYVWSMFPVSDVQKLENFVDLERQFLDIGTNFIPQNGYKPNK